ncbi:type IX secretion system motor protein PorM/GldM [Saccharicrinis fermentans]|uniref:Gliding motility-associated protein GldM n=1 Tax=Saccharicrinis fermentans DSM 9555 = JCM 21142 TaxID=869213 RepID=W7XY04_9BACT|nr:gliding motility protein GldM [Saccharicrinis fermentans]GAF03450.1 gliding motility-associated protein GldM [Saccharicrinis fermentans DSM 9555 = JCM 21142]
MSGGNCPETPRQKMIGMMYLFLTAMLALNVSGELLLAFVSLDEGFNQTRETVERKNESLYTQFKTAFETNRSKAQEEWDKAQKVQAASDSLVNHIQDIKLVLAQTVSGPEATPESYAGIDNQDVAAQVMIVEKAGARSKELKRRMTEFKDLLVSMLDPNDVKDTAYIHAYETVFNTDDVKDEEIKTWESTKFEHVPLAASMAMLSKIQGDVRNAEADVVANLMSDINKDSYKFDELLTVVKPFKTTVLEGETYKAEVYIAAYDPTVVPEIVVDGQKLKVGDGKGLLEQTKGVGEYKWTGNIKMPTPDGTGFNDYPVEGEYQVVKPSAVISPIKMNVFYEGVDNPVAISVPGVASNALKISMTNVVQKRSGANFIVRPKAGTAGRKSIVSVSAEIGGKTKFIGKQEFRIKRVPDPVPTVAGESGGKIRKNVLLAQSGVFAEMKDFDFELEYKVTRFTVSVLKGGYIVDEPSKSSKFTAQQKELIKGMSRGAKVSIEGIRAKGPSGTRDLGTITFVLD